MLNFFSVWWWMGMINWAGTISVLLLNAIFILSDTRFLARLDLAVPRPYPQTRTEERTNRAVILLRGARGPVRAILIPLNAIIFVVQLLWG